MFRSLMVVALVAGFGLAEDKKAEKPVLKGTWTKEANGITIELKFVKDGELVVAAAAGDNGISVDCKYTVEKDGTIKATVKGSKETGSFPQKPKDGAEFSFKVKTEGKSIKVSNFESKDLEGAHEVMEGEYTSKDK